LGVYECPVPYKRLVSPQLLGWLGHTGRFAFLKDTCCDLEQIKLRIEAVRGTQLQIYNANISTGMSSIQYGAKGLASTASNFYPELLQYLSQNPNLQNKESNRLNNFITHVDSLIHENYPMSAKYFMQLRGMNINTLTRTPVGQFTHQDFVKFDKLFEAFEMLSEELEIEVYRF
jgi:4-hydroxy-tetrahydrodipicolinate synthase